MTTVTLNAPSGVGAILGSDGITYSVVSGKVTVPNSQVSSLLAQGFTYSTGGAASAAFIALSDAPGSYAGAAHKIVEVNAGATGLEFDTSITAFTQLTDAPASYASAGLKYVRVNAGATALEFATFPTLVAAFTGLSDAPANYTSAGLKKVRVNTGATALEFVAVAPSAPAPLTDAATIVVDASLSESFTVTIAGDRTLAKPTSMQAGQSLSFFITQGSGGNHTLAYASGWPASMTSVSLSTTAGQVDSFLVYTPDGSTMYLLSAAQNIT